VSFRIQLLDQANVIILYFVVMMVVALFWRKPVKPRKVGVFENGRGKVWGDVVGFFFPGKICIFPRFPGNYWCDYFCLILVSMTKI